MKSPVTRSILLVEDEFLISVKEQMLLEDYGYTATVVNNGERAVEAFRNPNSFDLVLMDIDLGDGIDGTEAARRILELREIPIVFLSSHLEPEVVNRTESISSYGYIVKDSGITVLDASIKMAFKLFDANQATELVKGELESTLKALPDLLLDVGLDGRIFDYHSPYENVLFMLSPDLLQKTVSALLPSDVAQLAMSAIEEAHETGSSAGKLYEMNMPAGRYWFELSVAPRMSHSAEPHFNMLVRNVTERKLYEKEIEDKEARFESLFSNAPIGIVYSTVDGKVIAANSEYARILGYASPEEAKQAINLTSLAEAVYARPEDRKVLIEQEESCVGEWVKTEQRYRKKDGSLILAKASFRATRENPQVLEGFLEDISGEERGGAQVGGPGSGFPD